MDYHVRWRVSQMHFLVKHGSQIVLKVLKILIFDPAAHFSCGDFSLKLGKLVRNMEWIEESQYL